jgi:hypothetical protein
MARIYLFADESGNFDFSRKSGASTYFIVTTISADHCGVGDDLITLRRDLAFSGMGLGSAFHATTDEQAVRDRVFPVIAASGIRVDSTILEKAKSKPSTRLSDESFYKLAWYLHLKYVASQVAAPHDELLVVAASVGTKKRRATFHAAVRDVVQQVSPTLTYQVASWDSMSDPCLQVADYVSWAIQRRWERDDRRSYDLVKHLIRSEFKPFDAGSVTYY